jgi:hypothetical protein
MDPVIGIDTDPNIACKTASDDATALSQKNNTPINNGGIDIAFDVVSNQWFVTVPFRVGAKGTSRISIKHSTDKSLYYAGKGGLCEHLARGFAPVVLGVQHFFGIREV